MPQVLVASRLPPATRAFINEADLGPFIKAHWDVDVISTGFNDSLHNTMEQVARTDVLLGIHGAAAMTPLPHADSRLDVLTCPWDD